MGRLRMEGMRASVEPEGKPDIFHNPFDLGGRMKKNALYKHQYQKI
jgi:hypothetical protein